MTLDEQLPQLIHQSDSQMTVQFNREVKKYGINAQAWRVLAALLGEDGRKVGELAAATGIELSTLSHLLTRMGGSGLVKRRRTGSDHRSVIVGLTPAGLALSEKVAPLAARSEELALEGFDEKEARILISMLKRVSDNIKPNGSVRAREY
ncbi:MAG: MarR family winged helix-turn-helix transcriptional regulator [Alphaproteobacteria bacterium]